LHDGGLGEPSGLSELLDPVSAFVVVHLVAQGTWGVRCLRRTVGVLVVRDS
jgi:hypothetical protein